MVVVGPQRLDYQGQSIGLGDRLWDMNLATYAQQLRKGGGQQ